MCILAIQYKTVSDAPILVAHNREEYFDRPTQPPKIQSGKPRAVCGIDRKAGGTWLGVNQHGLFVAALNRKSSSPADPRSRGVLCRSLLGMANGHEAVSQARHELSAGCYDGTNVICADSENGFLICGGGDIEPAVTELEPGLHLVTNGKLDDRKDIRQEFIRRQLTLQKIESPVTFLAMASRAFARKPDASGRRGVVISGDDFGTVSSTLLSLTSRIQNAVYQYAPGPPSEHSYDDYSALLRQVLSTDREKRSQKTNIADG